MFLAQLLRFGVKYVNLQNLLLAYLCKSIFRFQSRSLKPLGGFLPDCIHDVTHACSRPMCLFGVMIFDLFFTYM